MSHIFDVFNWFARDQPKKVTAFGGQTVFVPDPNAPECCPKCTRDCPYRVGGSEENVRPDTMVDFDTSRLQERDIIKRHDTCVWFPGADTDDHGLINVEYARGVKASLFWAVFGPDTDDQETMELVGEKGRIILIRQIGKLDVVADYGKRHEVLDARGAHFTGTHFGADDEFIRELDRFCKGAAPTVTAQEGLLATRLVEAALRSSQAGGRLVPMDEVEDA
jgi:predicted dehydrogenase